MIPLRDTIPSKRYPVVNITLIGINIIVYIIQLLQGPYLEQFIYTWGLIPARYSISAHPAHITLFQQFFVLVTFMFLHGGFWHILGNMWCLYIFGDNVEDSLGSFYYLVFYLAAGIASGVFHIILNFHSTTPTIGASGAIAGVMGAYFILYPNARILTLIPIFIFPWFVEIPAFFFLGIWFIFQVLNAAGAGVIYSPIAWWAHIGGFLFGVITIKIFNVSSEGRLRGPKKQLLFKKKKSDWLKILQPSFNLDDLNLHDVIRVTPYEAMVGAQKMINIRSGLYSRMYRVAIPANTYDGLILRLRGLGRHAPDSRRGDLYLKVIIEQPW